MNVNTQVTLLRFNFFSQQLKSTHSIFIESLNTMKLPYEKLLHYVSRMHCTLYSMRESEGKILC